MLLLFVLLVFALMGIAALTIDVGYAFLAQGQMQNATDSAAVEGARLRNYHQTIWYSSRARRSRVEETVRQVFDDDLHPHIGNGANSIEYPFEFGYELPADNNADSLRMSMGPAIKLVADGTSQGGNPHNIGATIITSLPNSTPTLDDFQYLDDPQVGLNPNNLQHGDMVSGKFQRISHAPGDGSAFTPFVEGPGYSRADFERADPDGAVPSAGNADIYESLGFLVRLRRIKQDYPADDTQGGGTGTGGTEVPKSSSHGATVPYIFGLGTAMHRFEGSSYNPRTDGISVRSTSIASSAPAFAVGYPPCSAQGIYNDNSNLGTRVMGHYGVFFDLGFWQAITVAASSSTQWNGVCYYAEIGAQGDLIFKGAMTCGTAPGSGEVPAPWVEEYKNDPVGTLGDRGNVIGDEVYPLSIEAFQYGTDRDNDGTVTAEDKALARCRWLGLTGPITGTFVGDARGYFGVYKNIVSTNPVTDQQENKLRVIGFGFGRATILLNAGPLGTEDYLVFGPGLPYPHLNVECWVAQDNASAHLQLALLKDELEVITPNEWAQVMTANQYFTYQSPAVNPNDYLNINRGAVLAATLVR